MTERKAKQNSGCSGSDGVAKVRTHAFEGGFGGEAVLCAEGVDLAVLDELVGPADAHDGRFDACSCEVLDHGAAEAVGEDVVFEGDDAGAHAPA